MGQKKRSMKWQMMGILLICWMIPFAFLIGIFGVYLASNHSDMTAANYEKQLEINNRICVERLNGAVASSRRASYDELLLGADEQYRSGKITYVEASKEYQNYLSSTYQKDDAIMAVILQLDSLEGDHFTAYNEGAGGTYQHIRKYINQDQEDVLEFSRGLDTKSGFLCLGNTLYLVRNLMDTRYERRGVLVFCLNQRYCFGNLKEYPSGDGVYITINQAQIPLAENARLEQWIAGREETSGAAANLEPSSSFSWNKGRLYVTNRQKGDNYTIETAMLIQKEVSQFPFYGYPYVLVGMILILFPMLLMMMYVFRRQVSAPVSALSEGARKIQEGELGYQISLVPGNLEFDYLTQSMNRMSVHLKQQFDKIYQEEVALREARIMALQSHINPHFLNNTLEIINWEARLEGNLKISKMIDALSTVLDAAMDRRRRPMVRLAEEVGYVGAYLYITGERLGKRLTVHWEIPEELTDYLVPRLILQPVVENAVEHGVVPNGSGTIMIRGYARERYLYLEIVNDGCMTGEDQRRIDELLGERPVSGKESSLNLGIANVNQRLKIIFGECCGLSINRAEDGKTVARLDMGLVRTEEEIGRMDKNIQ